MIMFVQVSSASQFNYFTNLKRERLKSLNFENLPPKVPGFVGLGRLCSPVYL